MASEIRWGCGCHEVEGKLEVECTQTPLQGEVSSAQHAVAKPFSPKCFRKAAIAQTESDKAHEDLAKAQEEVAAVEGHEGE